MYRGLSDTEMFASSQRIALLIIIQWDFSHPASETYNSTWHHQVAMLCNITSAGFRTVVCNFFRGKAHGYCFFLMQWHPQLKATFGAGSGYPRASQLGSAAGKDCETLIKMPCAAHPTGKSCATCTYSYIMALIDLKQAGAASGCAAISGLAPPTLPPERGGQDSPTSACFQEERRGWGQTRKSCTAQGLLQAD